MGNSRCGWAAGAGSVIRVKQTETLVTVRSKVSNAVVEEKNRSKTVTARCHDVMQYVVVAWCD